MGAGAKIALVALGVLAVVAIAKFVQSGGAGEGESPGRAQPSARMADARDAATLAELPPQEAPRQVIMCFGPDELYGEEAAAMFARQGLEITGMVGIVHGGDTVGVIVSLKQAEAK